MSREDIELQSEVEILRDKLADAESKLSAAEAKIAELKGELDNVFRHLQIVSDQSDERRRSAEDAESRLGAIRAIVDAQAEDDGLWFVAQTAPEAYLQLELRKLHAAIEGVSPEERSREIDQLLHEVAGAVEMRVSVYLADETGIVTTSEGQY